MASVFSKIIAGELPGHFIWEDDVCVAILTIQPLTPGHVLVVPRAEIDHWDDLPADMAAHLMVIAQKMAKAIKVAFPSLRVGLVIAGLEVPHTHIHVFPVDSIGDFDFSQAKPAFAEELQETAEKLRAAI